MYSQMLLTQNTDYLKAIAAIASEFALLITPAAPSQAEPSQIVTSHTEAIQIEPSLWPDGCQAQYVSGFWLHDMHYGLLWQSLSQSPQVCDCGAPSWSWIYFVGLICWFPTSSWQHKVCKVLSVIREEQHNPDLYFIIQPSGLILLGKLLPVLAHGYMSEDVYSEVTNMTHYRPKKLPVDGIEYHHVRQSVLISPISDPDIAAGWAIFDRPDLLTATQFEEPQSYMTLALCITSSGKVANVLFVELVEEGEARFRRVGVGSIADPTIAGYFTNAEDIQTTLI